MIKMASFGAAMGLAIVPAMAGSMETVKVNLPYEARIGNVLLPAGHYTIQDVKDTGATAVLRIKSDDNKLTNAFVTAHEVVANKNASTDNTKVVLHQDENGSYNLQSIFVEGHEVGFEMNAAE
jgi:hypothetical protein